MIPVCTRLTCKIALLSLLACSAGARAQTSADAAERSARTQDFIAAYNRRAEDVAMGALTEIARRWPKTLTQFDDRVVLNVTRGGGDTEAADRGRYDLLNALFDAHWRLRSEVEPAVAWGPLVRMLVDRRERARAGQVMQRLRSPQTALMMRVDKRFDPLIRANASRFDVEALAQEQVSDWQAATRRFSRRLYDAYDLMNAYLQKGDYAEALRLADDALARIATAKSPDDLYDDVPAVINWVYDARALALRGLGNWEEAQMDLENAMQEKERGGRNVSNTINLASYYAEFGRADEAMATLGSLTEPNSPVSRGGRMIVTAIVHAAALAKGNLRQAKDALDYLREHEADHPWVLQDELARAGRVDEAATQLIRLLRNLESRSVALAYVQEYLEVPASPGVQQINRGRRQIVQRSDVRAAVLEVGRIERFSIPRD